MTEKNSVSNPVQILPIDKVVKVSAGRVAAQIAATDFSIAWNEEVYSRLHHFILRFFSRKLIRNTSE